MPLNRTDMVATKERLAALLCVLVVVAGVIFGLMVMVGFGFPFRL